MGMQSGLVLVEEEEALKADSGLRINYVTRTDQAPKLLLSITFNRMPFTENA